MELIRPKSKWKARIISIVAENILLYYMHKIKIGDERVDDKIDN